MKYILCSLLLLCLNNSELYSQCEYKLLASDGSERDNFGFSAAIENDRIIVGAKAGGETNNNEPGWAYIYDWNGIEWEESKIISSDCDDHDRFGEDVDLVGDRVLVGARWFRNGGAAYLYDLVGNSWVETKLTASDREIGDEFGRDLALGTDRVVVGAHGNDDNGTSSGSIYIYDWNGTSWDETKITASDAAEGDKFGFGVSIDQDRIVVGAIDDDNDGYDGGGSIYIYDWDGSDWIESKIYASDPEDNKAFGISTDVQGDTIVVGAYLEDSANGTNAGSVYIYIWDGFNWEETKLTASDGGGTNHYFGGKVRIEDNRIVVGALGHAVFRGKIYIYDWDGSNWVETSLQASDGSAHKRFGASVDLSGERIVSGTYNDPTNGSAAGAVYIYDPSHITTNTFIGSNSDWNDPTNWSLELVPTTCNHVIIPAGKNSIIMDGQTGSCFQLTTENNGTLEVMSNAILNIVTSN